MASETKNIIMFGKTGAGKSLLGSVLLEDYNVFLVSSNTFSATKETTCYLNKLQNSKIFDTKGFLDTADEIEANLKENYSPQAMVLKALDTVECIADEGVNAILLAIKLDRISQAEGEFAKKTLMRLFSHECREKILLVITNSEDNLVDVAEERKKWLKENSENSGSNFKNYFALVNKNPEKVIFVNNGNPNTAGEKKTALILDKEEGNPKMAQKIFDVIQDPDNEAFKEKGNLSETIRVFKADLEEEMKKASAMKLREEEIRQQLRDHANETEKDREEIKELKKKLDEYSDKNDEIEQTIKDKLQKYQQSIFGEGGLGAVPMKIHDMVRDGTLRSKIGKGLRELFKTKK